MFTAIVIIWCIVFIVFITKGEFIVSWWVHRDMVKSNCNTYSKGTYDDFLLQLSKHEWERDEKFPKSFFGIGGDFYQNKVHASIFMFDKVGMVFNIFEFEKVCKYLKVNAVNYTPKGD